MRLRQFAESLGISYSTALRMFRRDEIPGAYKLPSGTIVIPGHAIDILESSSSISDKTLMEAIGIIEEASREVMGDEDAGDLIQLIQRVLLEYSGGVVAYDGD
jgi:hypothetical protein